MINQYEFSYLTNIIYTNDIDVLKKYSTYTSPDTLIIASYNMNTYYNYKYYSGTSYELYFIDYDHNIHQLTYNLQEGNGIKIIDNKFDLIIDNDTIKEKNGYIYVDIENFPAPSSLNKGIFTTSSDIYYNDNSRDIINSKKFYNIENNVFSTSPGFNSDFNTISYYKNTCNSLIININQILYNKILNIQNAKVYPGNILYKNKKNVLSLTYSDGYIPYLVCVIGSDILPDRYPRFIPINRRNTSYIFDNKNSSLYVLSSYSNIPIYTDEYKNININSNITKDYQGYIATTNIDWKDNYVNPLNSAEYYYFNDNYIQKLLYLDNSVINYDYTFNENALYTEVLNTDLINQLSNLNINIELRCVFAKNNYEINERQKYYEIKYNVSLYPNTDEKRLVNVEKIENITNINKNYNILYDELQNYVEENYNKEYNYNKSEIYGSNNYSEVPDNLKNYVNPFKSKQEYYGNAAISLQTAEDLIDNDYRCPVDIEKYRGKNDNYIYGCGGGGYSCPNYSNPVNSCSPDNSDCSTDNIPEQDIQICRSDCIPDCPTDNIPEPEIINEPFILSGIIINISKNICTNVNNYYIDYKIKYNDNIIIYNDLNIKSNNENQIITIPNEEIKNKFSDIDSIGGTSIECEIIYYSDSVNRYINENYYKMPFRNATKIDENYNLIFDFNSEDDVFEFKLYKPILTYATCIYNKQDDLDNINLNLIKQIKIINKNNLNNITYIKYIFDKSYISLVNNNDNYIDQNELKAGAIKIYIPSSANININDIYTCNVLLQFNKILPYTLNNIPINNDANSSIKNITIDDMEFVYDKTDLINNYIILKNNDIIIKNKIKNNTHAGLILIKDINNIRINSCKVNNNYLNIKFEPQAEIINNYN